MVKILTLALAASSLSWSASPQAPALNAAERAVTGRISASRLRARLSFLASDALQGRDTPSPGLDVAAEYIASEFRRAGLEPGGNDGYFQTASMVQLTPNKEGFSLKLEYQGRSVEAGPDGASLSLASGLSLTAAPVFKLDLADPSSFAAVKPTDLDGRVVIAQAPHRGLKGIQAAFHLLSDAKPTLLLLVGESEMLGSGERLVDASPDSASARQATPRVAVHSPALSALFDSLPPGAGTATVTLTAPEPLKTPFTLRNVVAVLRGSDPALKSTYVMVTAHYDHIGMKKSGEGDRIYNGANDDGSGTVSVVELAQALAAARPRPRRSLVFMTFFGEEKGELGSRYYAAHPLFPLARTVADLNLEQVGRTDSTDGPQVGTASLTGFGYSTLSDILVKAGKLTGVKVYRNAEASDAYFSRSDNQKLADAGIPAHTLCVAFDYPDYHGLGDEWQKVDYSNMARVDRAVAVALMMVADDPATPRWNPKNSHTARYLKAFEQLHGGQP